MDDADTDLMAAPSLGDPGGAAEQLVEHYGDQLYRLALRITGVQEDAERALEDALRTAARTTNSFTDESALRSWIYRTVAYAAHQRRKHRQHDTAALDDVVPLLNADGHFEPMDDWSNRIDEPALQGGLRSSLVEAIDALPADYVTALILHDVEGASKQEIAEILDIDVPAVNSRVHRARLFVRERLSRYFESSKSGPRIGVNP
jgi:RNA polymerase sigma-70 factor (ECF subfamily)